jgi:hypothetical protein
VSGFEVQDQVQTLPLNFIDRRRSEEMIAQVRRYVGERLNATGGPDFGRVVVEQASVVEQPHVGIGGVRGVLTPEPSTDFVGLLAVRVAVADGSASSRATPAPRSSSSAPSRRPPASWTATARPAPSWAT